MSSKHRWLRVLALLLGLSLIAAACGDDDDEGATDETTDETEEPTDEEVERGGEVVDLSAMAGDPPSHIDPLLSTTVAATQIGGSVYDGLTTVDYTGDEPVVRGQVAESWESNEDATVWTFQIREGLSFSNGEPVLPSSFKRGIDIGANLRGNYSYLYAFLEGGEEVLDPEGPGGEVSGVVADDEAMTLEITLANGWAEFDAVAGFKVFEPMPEARELEEGFDAESGDLSTWEQEGGMIGNGPFMLESWAPDFSEVVMVPNPEWDGTAYDEELGLPEQPYLDKVTLRASDSIETAFNSFEAGEGDIAAIPPGQVSYADENYQTLLDQPALGAYYFQINERNELIGGDENLLLRRAIMQAIDREDINQVVYEGTRSVATGITPPGIPGFEEGICQYCNYDPEAAEANFQAWQDEGNSLDQPIPIQFNEGFGHEDVVAIIVENLAAIGVEAVPDGRSSDTYFDDLANGECVICRAGWLADYPTYGNFQTDLFHGVALDGNNYGFIDEEYDSLLDQAQVETDDEARAELYHQAESRLLNDEAGTIPINWYKPTTVYNPDTITNLYEDPSFHIHWETIQVEQ